MTCQDAVSRVVKILTTSKYDPVSGTNTRKVTIPVFPFSVKKNTNVKEYIVVNTLGFPQDILQVGFVNINIHVEDKQGLVDNKRLYSFFSSVKALTDVNSPRDEENYIDLELVNEQVFQGDNGDHYVSMKYKVAMLN